MNRMMKPVKIPMTPEPSVQAGGPGRSAVVRRVAAGSTLCAALLIATFAPAAAVEERSTTAKLAPAAKAESTRSQIKDVLRNQLRIDATIESTLAEVQFELAELAELALLPDDSIYATEITIDRHGKITVLDREGNRYRLEDATAPVVSRFTDRPGRRDRSRDNTHTAIVHIGSDITIEEDEVIDGDVICIFCDVRVLGEVSGSAVSVFGTTEIEGVIGSDAIAPFGTVHIGPEARIRGDVVASRIHKAPGGRIGGTRNEILFDVFGDEFGSISQLWTQTTLTAVVLLKILFWLFLVLLAYALASKNVVRIKQRIQGAPVKSFVWGILAQILFLPAILILFITVIGIPVALFLLPLMVVAAFVLSYAAMGLLLGEKIDENTGIPLHTPLGRMITGNVGLHALALMSLAFFWTGGSWQGGGVAHLTAIVLGSLAVFQTYVVLTVGTGAVLITRFGTRPKDEAAPAVLTGDEPESGPTASEPNPLPNPTRPNDSGTAPAVS